MFCAECPYLPASMRSPYHPPRLLDNSVSSYLRMHRLAFHWHADLCDAESAVSLHFFGRNSRKGERPKALERVGYVKSAVMHCTCPRGDWPNLTIQAQQEPSCFSDVVGRKHEHNGHRAVRLGYIVFPFWGCNRVPALRLKALLNYLTWPHSPSLWLFLM